MECGLAAFRLRHSGGSGAGKRNWPANVAHQEVWKIAKLTPDVPKGELSPLLRSLDALLEATVTDFASPHPTENKRQHPPGCPNPRCLDANIASGGIPNMGAKARTQNKIKR